MTEIEGISSQETQGLKEKTAEINLNEKESSNGFGSVENLDVASKETKKENKEREKTMEIVENWVDQYLNEDVLDEYALSYEKSKKTKEQKRQNKKYQKYLEKAQEELKPRLTELLEEKIQAGELDSNETEQEVILETIETTLKSDMHAKTLLKAMKKHLEKNQMENSAKIKDLNSQESKVGQNEQIEANKEIEKEAEENLSADKEVEMKENPSTDGERETESNKNPAEAPQTEKEFFDIYQNQKGSYLNIVDGSEVKILKYDPEKKEVHINKYQSFAYDQETESWGPVKEKNGEMVLDYNDFLGLIKGYVFDSEDYFSDDSEKKKQASQEVSKENKNEKQELSAKEKVVIEIFNKYIDAKKQAIKKEVQDWHKSEEGGYMSTFTCNSVAYDLEIKFLKEDLPEKIESKFEENGDDFDDVDLDKILSYFQNLTDQKEQARENF